MAIAKGLSIYINGHNLACAFKSFGISDETEALDATVLCQTSKTYAQGFQQGSISASGVWDADQTNQDKVHNVLTAALAAQSDCVITASLSTLAVGGKAIMAIAPVKTWGIELPLGQLIMCNADFDATNGINFGAWIFSASVASTTTNGASQDGLAASTNGGTFHVHYQDTDSSSRSFKFQHSSDNSTWVDLATITLTGDYDADTYSVSAGTTINRYVRGVGIAAGGTATFQAAFARR